jgi:hypothetical protein
LEIEKDDGRLGQVAQSFVDEWDGLLKLEGLPFLKLVLGLVEQGKKAGLGGSLLVLEKKFGGYIEHAAWQEPFPAELEEFITGLEESSLDAQTYLQRFFNEGKYNKYVLRLFFQFFPEKMPVFSGQLIQRGGDVELVGPIVGLLPDTQSALVSEVLESLYASANEVLRIEILTAMQRLPSVDENFIVPIIKTGDYALKKEALAVVVNDASVLLKVLDMLLALPNSWGSQNEVLLENVTLVQEVGVREAYSHLVTLSNRPFFWNAAVRKRAKEVIEVWNA